MSESKPKYNLTNILLTLLLILGGAEMSGVIDNVGKAVHVFHAIDDSEIDRSGQFYTMVQSELVELKRSHHAARAYIVELHNGHVINGRELFYYDMTFEAFRKDQKSIFESYKDRPLEPYYDLVKTYRNGPRIIRNDQREADIPLVLYNTMTDRMLSAYAVAGMYENESQDIPRAIIVVQLDSKSKDCFKCLKNDLKDLSQKLEPKFFPKA